MGKHSFVYDANSFKNIKPKVSRFNPDHGIPDIGELRYTWGYGPLVFSAKRPFSEKFAVIGLVLLVISFIMWVLGSRINHDPFVVVSVGSFVFFWHSLLARYQENTPEREARNAGKVKKNRLRLASFLGFPGFILIVYGLTSSYQTGVFGYTAAWVGSAMTLVSFYFINYAEKSERRFGWRELLMTLLFLPATIALFVFFGLIGAFFNEIL